MKITTSQLRRLIREEVSSARRRRLHEGPATGPGRLRGMHGRRAGGADESDQELLDQLNQTRLRLADMIKQVIAGNLSASDTQEEMDALMQDVQRLRGLVGRA